VRPEWKKGHHTYAPRTRRMHSTEGVLVACELRKLMDLWISTRLSGTAQVDDQKCTTAGEPLHPRTASQHDVFSHTTTFSHTLDLLELILRHSFLKPECHVASPKKRSRSMHPIRTAGSSYPARYVDKLPCISHARIVLRLPFVCVGRCMM